MKKEFAMKNKSISVILMIVGIVCATAALLPLFYGILNFGNTALGGFGCGTLALSATQNLKNSSYKIWQGLRTLLATVLAAFAVAGAGISVCMLHACASAPRSDTCYTVIVLGCQVKDGEPSAMLKRRLDVAVDYLRAHPDSPAVVSGGGNGNEHEASVMKKYLTHAGIPSSMIYTEGASHNTKENISFSAQVIQENGLPQAVAIASDGFHIFRAGIYAQKNGLTQTAAIPARTPLGVLPVYWVREWFAVLKAWFLDGP